MKCKKINQNRKQCVDKWTGGWRGGFKTYFMDCWQPSKMLLRLCQLPYILCYVFDLAALFKCVAIVTLFIIRWDPKSGLLYAFRLLVPKLNGKHKMVVKWLLNHSISRPVIILHRATGNSIVVRFIQWGFKMVWS